MQLNDNSYILLTGPISVMESAAKCLFLANNVQRRKNGHDSPGSVSRVLKLALMSQMVCLLLY